MTTLGRITELETEVKNAITYNADGRQIVANACKELYRLVEGDYYEAGADELVNDMYRDLTAGNFSEPFPCEMQKGKFELYRKIYVGKVCNILENLEEQ